MTSSDRFPEPVRSAVKSNLTDWCFQNLSKRALNALTVQASTTELGKLFQRVSLKHDGTDGPVKSVNTDGTAIERADGTANTGANYQIITY